MDTILSYGLGCESSAILARWLFEPNTRPCPLSELIVVTAQTGDEYEDTQELVDEHILPLLRQHGVRYVQVARHGHLEADGITVLEDSCAPSRLFLEGDYKLSDELRAAGTVPQFGGEHVCSLKFKAFPIEVWLRDYFRPIHPEGSEVRHAFGYNVEEGRRVAKSEASFEQRRIAFGFNSHETRRVARAQMYDTPQRIGFYPLVEWNWTRQDCLDYLQGHFGVLWPKSSCVYCPFNSLREDGIERHKRHTRQLADALMLEHMSLTLNPRGTLYRDKSLIQITGESGNVPAIEAYQGTLYRQPWALYRVRRIYFAARDQQGNPLPSKKGTAMRCVERLIEGLTSTDAILRLRTMAETLGQELVEQRKILYLYTERCGDAYPTREAFYVAAPAVVDTKARYGVARFEEHWEQRQQELFSAAA